MEFTGKCIIPFTKVSSPFRQFYLSTWKPVIYYDNTFTLLKARAFPLRIIGKRIKRYDSWR